MSSAVRDRRRVQPAQLGRGSGQGAQPRRPGVPAGSVVRAARTPPAGPARSSVKVRRSARGSSCEDRARWSAVAVSTRSAQSTCGSRSHVAVKASASSAAAAQLVLRPRCSSDRPRDRRRSPRCARRCRSPGRAGPRASRPHDAARPSGERQMLPVQTCRTCRAARPGCAHPGVVAHPATASMSGHDGAQLVQADGAGAQQHRDAPVRSTIEDGTAAPLGPPSR